MIKKISTLLFFVCSIYSITALAELKISVDRDVVSVGETVQLTIHSDSDNETPDIRPLKENFDIVSTGQSSEVAVYNGQSQVDNMWIFVLMPRKMGAITIPSLKIGTERTTPLTINVKNNSTSPNTVAVSKDDTRHVFMTAELSPESPYVQSQATYSLKLFYDRQIERPELSEPQADNTTFIHMGRNKSYQTTLNGKTYQVMELQFAMFGQKSGEVTIHSPTFSGNSMIPNSGQYFSNLWAPFKVNAPDIKITFKAVPANANASWWLPAKEIKLEDNWSEDITHLTVGSPITRSITITAEGVLANELPEVMPKTLAHFQIYPDKPKIDNKDDENNIVAQKIEKASFIPDKEGTYTIPAIKIKWWNIKTNKIETAIIPEKTVTVAPAAGTADMASTPMATAPASAQEPSPKPMAINLNAKPQSIWVNPWFWATNALVFLWICTLAYFWFHKIKKHKQTKQKINDEKAHRQAHIRNLKNDAHTAARNNDTTGFKNSIIDIANALWRDKHFLSLGDVINHIDDSKAKAALQNLETLLYKNQETEWDGVACWREIQTAFMIKKEKKLFTPEPLPQLYK